jgi:nucleolar protein 56
VKAYILETPIGLLALNEKGIVMEKFLTETLSDDNLLDFLHYNENICNDSSFSEFVTELQKKNFDLITETKEMKSLLESVYKGKIETSPLDNFFRDQRVNILQILSNFGLFHSHEQLIKISRSNAKRMSRDLVRESGQNTDVHIINAVGVLENTAKFLNSYAIQLREWYGSHFPELTDKLVNDIELYAKIVYLFEKRDSITAKQLISELHVKEEYAQEIEYQAKNSMGGDLTESQLNAIRLFSKNILNLVEFRDQLEKSVNNILQELCPNLFTILGAQLTGKLITHAGGLENLAKMASSTIQVLGAEKALFRALRKKTDSPKHGVIYTWAQIRSAKYWQRGKISRLLSGKISICAKVDYFKGDFIGDKILKELETKIADIKEKFPEPPKVEKKTKEAVNDSQKKKEIARKKAQHLSKSKYKSGVKYPRRN